MKKYLQTPKFNEHNHNLKFKYLLDEGTENIFITNPYHDHFYQLHKGHLRINFYITYFFGCLQTCPNIVNMLHH